MGTRILLIEDSVVIRNQLRLALEAALEVDTFLEASDGLQGFKLLSEERPDLVLCDLVMPTFDGLKFLSLRASRPELAQIPVIMLTAESDLNRKVEVFDRGASDYVTKPFHEKELIARVRVHYRLKALQDELRGANTRLEALATTDSLTGLFNRRYLDSVLLAELRRTLRYKTPLSLVMMDLDRFKSVNDTYGHAMGDEVLRNVGRVIAAGVRNTDAVTRYGGEEFLLLLPHTPMSGASDLAERLRRRIADHLHVMDGMELKVSASFGIAGCQETDLGVTPEELVKRADEALYQAKAAGRNRVVVWQAPPDTEAVATLPPG